MRSIARGLVVAYGVLVFALPAVAQEPDAPTPPPPPAAAAPDALPKAEVTDAERSAIAITAYDLDLHLTPASYSEEVRATLTLRNVSAAPLSRIPLQISGSLRWQRVAAVGPGGLRPIDFTQSPIGTDADHTGFAQEAILNLAQPLAPGSMMVVNVFYTGEMRPSAARLVLLGTPPDRAAQTDWDGILPTTDAAATALRGFGNALWYPVAEPAAALGDGNKLFALIARVRKQGVAVSMRLRLTVEYVGDPPDAAIFNGILTPLTHIPDTDNTTVEETHGVATASWGAQAMGYRIPSLFLTAQHAAATADQMLNIVTAKAAAVAPYREAAKILAPLLTSWLGDRPGQLLLLDHPGEPFADHGFLAAQLAADALPEDIAPSLVRPLAQAALPSSLLWIAEGFPQFLQVLYTERTKGRAVAVAELDDTASQIALAEPDFTKLGAAGEPLISATSETYFRLKAAFVWWQLRELVGELALQRAVTAYRGLSGSQEADPHAFERTLAAIDHTDLAWFFEDWVYRDRGVPDLTIVQAVPRPLPARPGKDSGYLVAIDVRNDGDAIADVPVILRSGTRKLASRMRIGPHSTGSTRIVFEDFPEEVQVNDGSVPELQTTTHTLKIVKP